MGVSESINGAFYRTFYNYGKFVARRPCCLIWVAVIISFLLSARFMPLSFLPNFPLPTEVEQDKLWVPQTAQAIDDKAKYDAIFSTTFRRNVIYFTTSPPGGNVLTKSVLSEVRRFDEMVNNNVTAWTLGGVTGDNGRTSRLTEDLRMDDTPEGKQYEHVCAQSAMTFGGNDTDIPNCQLFGHPLELWYRVGGIFEFDYTDAEIAAIVDRGKGIDETIWPETSNRTVNVEATFGGIERDADGHIVSAKAIQMAYLLGESAEGTPERAAAVAWEDQLNYFISPVWTDDPPLSTGSAFPGGLVWESSIIEAYPQTAGATSRELGKTIRGDLIPLNVGFIIILAYAVFIFARCQPKKSRACLAVAGCVSCVGSIGIAFGLPTLLGIKFNPVVQVLPFILIGIGVDDMFVLIAALEAQPTDLPVAERMGRAMGQAGVSITITSLTDVFAFLLGTTSQLPALSSFCIFAAVGITADFILQITFFAAWMAMDAYRERNDKVDCCPCCCPTTKAEEGCCCCCCTYGTGKALKPLGLKAFLVRFYIPLLRNPVVKVLILLGFTGLTGISAFYASKLKQDFQFRWFVYDDAALQQVFDVQDTYFASTGQPVYIVTPPSAEVDYTSIANQQKLAALGDSIQANPYIEADSVSNWYPTFREWLHSCDEITDSGGNHAACLKRDCEYTLNGQQRKLFPYCSHKKILTDAAGNDLEETVTISGTSRTVTLDVQGAAQAKYLVLADGSTAPVGTPIEETFVPPGKFYEYLDQFCEDAPLGAIFASEIIWVHNTTNRVPSQVSSGLSASRLRANYKSTDKAEEQVASMQTLRESVGAANLGTSFPYMFMYLYYEQYAIIVQEALLNLSLALLAVFLICLVVIANLPCAILVMLCVILVDIDILGLMYVWGLTIDSVSIINLVLAIGLAVDYSAHVAHAFMTTPGTRQERVDKAIEEMGTAVIHGAFSTFLAVLVLSVSKSYIFRSFFKQFFGICVFGASHGLILLPTILSLVGPAHQSHSAAPADDASAKGKDVGGIEVAGASTPATPPVAETPASPPPSAPQSSRGSGSGSPSANKVAPHVC